MKVHHYHQFFYNILIKKFVFKHKELLMEYFHLNLKIEFYFIFYNEV